MIENARQIVIFTQFSVVEKTVAEPTLFGWTAQHPNLKAFTTFVGNFTHIK